MSDETTSEMQVEGGQPAAPLRSVHTSNFPQVLAQLGASLFVSTYQTGKVIALRNDGSQLNTHFRGFAQPMGMALSGNTLALGTARSVITFRNVPAAAARLEPAGKHDACFLPRSEHVTGNIDGHELGWAGNELWIVNTRFSCLCTLDAEHSFVPRWRPRFVSGFALEDRCHLNGLAMRDGRPRYASALGESDAAAGWRENKAHGGIVIDIESNEIIARGLSMPHSPRWHDDRLWLLESGEGSIGTVDLASGRYEKLAELPGFTRGLSFLGPYAFIGLSQVRQSNVFGGIPLTERLSERVCGVWVLDTRNGQVVAWVKFEDAVQEIFAVEVLPGMRFPELASEDPDLIASTYVLPDAALQEVQRPPRAKKS